jgi:hypothetical protein
MIETLNRTKSQTKEATLLTTREFSNTRLATDSIREIAPRVKHLQRKTILVIFGNIPL